MSVIGVEPWSIPGDIDGLDGRTNGRRYEDFRVPLPGGQRLRISVTSPLIDPMVQVFAPGGTEPLDQDDDSGQGVNARLIFTPPATAEYVIRVIGVFPQLNGPYLLSIDPARPLPDPIPAQGGAVGETTRWTEYEGSLEAQDASIDGLYFEDYGLNVAAGEDVFVRLDSDDFDPVVQVFAAANREGGPLQADDDSGPGQSSLLLFSRPQAGEYVVRVTTFSARRPTGRYRLRIGR
jgi:hypothetical protein